MSLSLVNVVIRHERRIRLLFDGALAAAAFTSSSYYAVTNTDGTAADILTLTPIAVAGNANAVELALGTELADGAMYLVAVTAVPAADLSTATGSQSIRLGAPVGTVNREVSADDVDALLYGVDCVWTGVDYLETASGDLAQAAGPDVVRADLEHALLADGLPWDPSFGAHPRKYIDGAPTALSTLRGSLVRQALRDDRVKSVNVDFVPDFDNQQATFEVSATLKGADDVVTVPVPITTS